MRVGALIAVGGIAVAVASCGGGITAEPIGAGGEVLPRKAAATTKPEVAQFDYPGKFWCLEAHPGQAQVIVGWSVPKAKRVSVSLDGRRLRSGIRDAPPFWVPAGGATGIGATVVFRCASGDRHRIKVRWKVASSPTVERVATIRKAPER